MKKEIEVLYQTKWTNLIESLAPYNKSKCAEAVTIKSGLVGDGVVCVNQFGEMESRLISSRYAQTSNNPPEQTRRYVKGTPRSISALVDPLFDQTNTSVDLLDGYALSAIKGMNLTQDRMVIQGIFGTNYTEDGSVKQDFDTSMVVPLSHGVRTAPSSTSGTVILQEKFNPKGLTFEKLIRAKSLILSRGGSDDINAIISHSDYENLLLDPRVTTVEYMNSGRVERGNVTRIANIAIYISEAIPGGLMAEYSSDAELNEKDRSKRKFYWTASTMGTGVSRMIPVFSRDAVTLGIWKEITKTVNVRADVNNNLQLFYAMKMGATRTNENHVAKILVSDS